MLRHISKRAGSRAVTLAIAVASVGCTAMASGGPAVTACEAGDSRTASSTAPSAAVESRDAQKLAAAEEVAKPASVEERHFDIYKRFRILSGAAAYAQVSGGGAGRGRGNAGTSAATSASATDCSIRDLNTSSD